MSSGSRQDSANPGSCFYKLLFFIDVILGVYKEESIVSDKKYSVVCFGAGDGPRISLIFIAAGLFKVPTADFSAELCMDETIGGFKETK